MTISGMGQRRRGLPGGAMRAALAGALLIAVTALAAACQTAPERPPAPAPLSFAHLPPLVFDLGRIEVVERPAAADPSDANLLFPTSPAAAVRLWIQERLQARGSAGVLRVTVDEASARSTPLATNTEFRDLFTEEQEERLDLRLRVIIEVIDESGAVRGSAIADARRSRTLLEGKTLAERERVYDEVVHGLLFDYNASQERAIRKYLHLYLR